MTPEELASRRKALRLSQAALGEVLGVPRNTIARWERGSMRIARPGWLEAALHRLESATASDTRPAEEVGLPTFRRFDNLPNEISSFIGRDQEIAECVDLLRETRLLTLSGAGGVGKSRLALRIAAAVQHDYRDGVGLVELGSLPNPALVPHAVAAALRMRERPGQNILDTLVEALRPRQLLVVLDNCEHLVLACAQLAEALLRAGSGLRILTTSREALGARGEIAWRVPSLRVPDWSAPLAEIISTESISLFLERARSVAPRFAITQANQRALIQVMRRLDGIPLALELAAARLKALRIEQVAERLDDRFQLLVGGARTALPRHQTLWATINWSYDLLEEDERRLFERLSVFAGGWTLEAAEDVCAEDSISVLSLLERLIDKSLVYVEDAQGIPRYRLLETLREFARERLDRRSDSEVIHKRHRDWVLSIADQINLAELVPATVSALGHEQDNLRAAVRWCIERQEIDGGLRLATAAAPLWNLRGQYAEGRTWLEVLLAAPSSAPELLPLRTRALKWNGILAQSQGDLAVAEANIREGFDVSRANGVPAEGPAFVQLLGVIRAAHGDLAAALPFYREALDRYRERGQPFWEAVTQSHVAAVLFEQGDLDGARVAAETCLGLGLGRDFRWATSRALCTLGRIAARTGRDAYGEELLLDALHQQQAIDDSMGAIHTFRFLGHLYLERGQGETARLRFLDALGLAQETGDRLGLARTLEGISGVVALTQPRDGAALLGAAAELRHTADARVWPTEQAYLERLGSTIRRKLGERDFAHALGDGQLLSAEQAAASARDWISAGMSSQHDSGERAAGPLTARQNAVAQLIARGYTNDQIAEALVISPATARAHIEHILDRLGLRSRAQIAAWAAGQPEREAIQR
jgi:non-specific serine/threonine protein kinase